MAILVVFFIFAFSKKKMTYFEADRRLDKALWKEVLDMAEDVLCFDLRGVTMTLCPAIVLSTSASASSPGESPCL